MASQKSKPGGVFSQRKDRSMELVVMKAEFGMSSLYSTGIFKYHSPGFLAGGSGCNLTCGRFLLFIVCSVGVRFWLCFKLAHNAPLHAVVYPLFAGVQVVLEPRDHFIIVWVREGLVKLYGAVQYGNYQLFVL